MKEILMQTLVLVATIVMLFGCAFSKAADPGSNSEIHADLFLKSQEFYAQGDHGRALEFITVAIEREPGWAELWNGRGYIKMKANDFEGAIDDFSKALELNENHVQYRHNLGVAYLESGKPSKGLMELNQVIEVAPKSDSALNHRGLAYSRLGEFDKATSDFTSAIALDGSNALYFLNRAVAHAKSGSAQLAKEDLNRAVDLNDSLKEAFESRGLIELEEGEFPSAIQDFSKAIALGEKHGLVFFNRAVALSMTGDLTGAREDYQQACMRGIAPACPEVVHFISWEKEVM